MKQIKGLCADLAERLELPQEALGGAVKLTAVDDRRLLIENHRGVASYSDICLRIRTAGGCLAVYGEDLMIRSLGVRTLAIEGKIRSMEWEE